MLSETIAEHREELILLDPHPEAVGIDHDYQGVIFTKQISDHIKTHIDQDGEYK